MTDLIEERKIKYVHINTLLTSFCRNLYNLYVTNKLRGWVKKLHVGDSNPQTFAHPIWVHTRMQFYFSST
jgi:hypothetical protein